MTPDFALEVIKLIISLFTGMSVPFLLLYALIVAFRRITHI